MAAQRHAGQAGGSPRAAPRRAPRSRPGRDITATPVAAASGPPRPGQASAAAATPQSAAARQLPRRRRSDVAFGRELGRGSRPASPASLRRRASRRPALPRPAPRPEIRAAASSQRAAPGAHSRRGGDDLRQGAAAARQRRVQGRGQAHARRAGRDPHEPGGWRGAGRHPDHRGIRHGDTAVTATARAVRPLPRLARELPVVSGPRR